VARQQRVETDAYGAMMGRMLASYGRRVAAMDIEHLADLQQFAADADRVLGETVAHLRTEAGGAHSWAQIGAALGITRASAQQRFARYVAAADDAPARRVGGQPAHLR
jgi:hypothetical protein